MKNRDSLLDFLKGFGILLMVMGHVGFGSQFDHVIHMFHMPLFFVLAGYLFNPQDYNLLKRAKRLFIPYCIFVVMNILVCIISNTIDYKWFINAILCPTDSVAGASWFLPILFGAQLFVLIEYRLLKSKKKVLIVATLIMGLAIFLPANMLFGIGTILFTQFYIVIGMIIREKKLLIKSFSDWSKWLVLILSLAYALWNGTTNLRVGNYGKFPIMYPLVSVLIIMMLVGICQNEWLEKEIVIKYFGRYSLAYMGFNQNLIMINKLIFGNLMNGGGIIGTIMLHSLELIITLIECSVLVIILKKLRFKWLY